MPHSGAKYRFSSIFIYFILFYSNVLLLLFLITYKCKNQIKEIMLCVQSLNLSTGVSLSAKSQLTQFPVKKRRITDQVQLYHLLFYAMHFINIPSLIYTARLFKIQTSLYSPILLLYHLSLLWHGLNASQLHKKCSPYLTSEHHWTLKWCFWYRMYIESSQVLFLVINSDKERSRTVIIISRTVYMMDSWIKGLKLLPTFQFLLVIESEFSWNKDALCMNAAYNVLNDCEGKIC